MKETFPLPVVCILVERMNSKGEIEILIQRRTKKGNDVAYYGFWELPQGKIRTGESIFVSACRELEEETGLTAVELNPLHQEMNSSIVDSSICAFHPLLCTIDLKYNFIGVGIMLKFTGDIHETDEASDHRWINKSDMLRLIKENQVFPLNVHIIEQFFAMQK